MNSFAELIENRRSTRHYTEEKLTPQEVEQILKTALTAPTSKNSKPWQFILVEDKDLLKKLSVSKSSGASFVADCALAIVVLSDPMRSEAHLEDASIAATFIQLQVEDLGLGSCWVQIRGREAENGQDSEDYIRDLLDIPFQLTVGCIVAIGHKARTGKPHDESKLLWEKVHIEKYKYDEPEQ